MEIKETKTSEEGYMNPVGRKKCKLQKSGNLKCVFLFYFSCLHTIVPTSQSSLKIYELRKPFETVALLG